MKLARSSLLPLLVVLYALMAVFGPGCGSGGRGTGSTEPLPLQDREGVAAALPKGVTMETPVVGDKMYGESSKTVEQALSAVQAHVQSGVLKDGALGQEIRFASPGGKASASKKGKKSALVIHLAN